MSHISWSGVTTIPIDDPDARLGLSAVWANGATAPGIGRALEAARAVSDREGWLKGR